uniref:Uncharacterized protein n=1 Tax=Anguilla anguilla TaxID=7936 RepID=A0A0E9VK41_ANGAN
MRHSGNTNTLFCRCW